MMKRAGLVLSLFGLVFSTGNARSQNVAPPAPSPQKTRPQEQNEQTMQFNGARAELMKRVLLAQGNQKLRTVGIRVKETVPCMLPPRAKAAECVRMVSGPAVVLAAPGSRSLEVVSAVSPAALERGERQYWLNWDGVAPLSVADGSTLYWVKSSRPDPERDLVLTLIDGVTVGESQPAAAAAAPAAPAASPPKGFHISTEGETGCTPACTGKNTCRSAVCVPSCESPCEPTEYCTHGHQCRPRTTTAPTPPSAPKR